MKAGDDVRVIHNNEEYEKEGIHKGMVGYIAIPEIRNNCFFVCFIDEIFYIHKDDPEWFEDHYSELKDDIFCEIKIQDLELIEESECTDDELL